MTNCSRVLFIPKIVLYNILNECIHLLTCMFNDNVQDSLFNNGNKPKSIESLLKFNSEKPAFTITVDD